jgi:hypothetical protein
METFENRLLQNSGCPLQGVVFCEGRGRFAVDVVAVAFLDAVGAAPVMPITASDVVEDIDVVLAFLDTDRDANDEDMDEDWGVISVTRLLGTGVRASDDRIDDICAETQGENVVQSNRGIVGEIMTIDIDGLIERQASMITGAQTIRALNRCRA